MHTFLLFLPTFTHLFTALSQQKQNICLPTNVLFLFIQAAGLVYHRDAVVDIIKGGSPPLYLITRQRASACEVFFKANYIYLTTEE